MVIFHSVYQLFAGIVNNNRYNDIGSTDFVEKPFLPGNHQIAQVEHLGNGFVPGANNPTVLPQAVRCNQRWVCNQVAGLRFALNNALFQVEFVNHSASHKHIINPADAVGEK